MIEPSKSRSRPRTRRSGLERLIDRTILEPTHPQLGTCWRFTGTTTPYGRIAKAQDSYTHRLGWKLLRGPIPEGKELHHRCGVYACWNPDHLQLVTHAENLAYVRKTACKYGHPLSGPNLRIDPQTGARVCRACCAQSQRSGSAKPQPSSSTTQDRPFGSLPRVADNLHYVNRSSSTTTASLLDSSADRQASVLSHAIWSTSHLNWTNPRVCVSPNLGPRPRAGPGSPSYAPAARGRDTQPAGRTLAAGDPLRHARASINPRRSSLLCMPNGHLSKGSRSWV
jgi:HNH endonuclease